MTDAANSDETGAASAPAGRRRDSGKRPGIVLQILLIVCALATVLGHYFGAEFDRSVPNLVTLVTTFIALTALLYWFSFRSSYPPLVRLLVFLSVIGTAVVGVACLRIDETTGTMLPVFRFRWQPKPDQAIARVERSDAEQAIDLTTANGDDFARYLGPNYVPRIDGPQPPLARDWNATPPKLLWKQPIGGGWSAFAAVNGYAVTLEQRGDEELATCYEARTGRLIWSHATPTRHETVLGGVGPRGTPAIHDGKVFTLGANGLVRCLDGATGRLLWKYDIYESTRTDADRDLTVVAWGRSGSPLIVDQKVVVPVGGPPGGPFVSLAALDQTSGQVVWKSGERQVSYASPMLATIAGKRQIVNVNEGSLSGHDPETGAALWEQEWIGHSNSDASTSQPNFLPGDRMLMTKGYGVGAALFQFEQAAGDKPRISEVWRNARVLRTKLTSAVASGDHAYGLSDGILECIDWTTGKSRWKKRGFEHGQILLVGDLLIVLSESGELALVEASPESFIQRGAFQALEGKTWNTICLHGRLLLVRNGQEAGCWELP